MLTTLFAAAIATFVCVFLRSRVPAFHSGRRKFLTRATAIACAAPTVALAAGFITRKDFYIEKSIYLFPASQEIFRVYAYYR